VLLSSAGLLLVLLACSNEPTSITADEGGDACASGQVQVDGNCVDACDDGSAPVDGECTPPADETCDDGSAPDENGDCGTAAPADIDLGIDEYCDDHESPPPDGFNSTGHATARTNAPDGTEFEVVFSSDSADGDVTGTGAADGSSVDIAFGLTTFGEVLTAESATATLADGTTVDVTMDGELEHTVEEESTC
jgi:hypothetical protein